MTLNSTTIRQTLHLQFQTEVMKLILANWPDDKHIICTINNDIPIKIPRSSSHFGKQKHAL